MDDETYFDDFEHRRDARAVAESHALGPTAHGLTRWVERYWTQFFPAPDAAEQD